MRIARLLVLSASFVLVTTAGWAGEPTTVRGDYRISFAGIPLATATLDLAMNGSTYHAGVRMVPSGVGNLVTAVRTRVDASGRVRRGLVDPARYFVEAHDREKGLRVSMTMRGRSVASLEALPPLRPHPDRVPVLASHKRGVVDPLSSGLMPYPGSAPIGPKACERTLKIFDGWTRYDVRLSWRRSEMVKVGDYEGPAAVCGARWVPVSGHRNNREAVAYLKANTGLEAWLIPIPGEDVLIPYRMSIRTRNGLIVVEAQDLSIRASQVASARG